MELEKVRKMTDDKLWEKVSLKIPLSARTQNWIAWSRNQDAAAYLRTNIEQKKMQHIFAINLCNVIDVNNCIDSVFAIANATPRQTAKAFLLTVK